MSLDEKYDSVPYIEGKDAKVEMLIIIASVVGGLVVIAILIFAWRKYQYGSAYVKDKNSEIGSPIRIGSDSEIGGL